MAQTVPSRKRPSRPNRGTGAFLICVVWLMVVALAASRLRPADAIVVAGSGLAALAITLLVSARSDRSRWQVPIQEITHFVRSARKGGLARPSAEFPAELTPLAHEISALVKLMRQQGRGVRAAPASTAAGPQSPAAGASLTRSGMHATPPFPSGAPIDPQLSGEYSTIDMVNRLEPATWHWIESSSAEQSFFGWTLEELTEKSFLDVIHPDDRPQARDLFAQALVRGEALGLVVRVRTAKGETRAIEVNVGARYGTNQRVTHLRCHLTDVTAKVRADRELRLRTRELTKVNEQLRRINRELEDLKDRYSDLYENAPAMYFSLDPRGYVVECNQTMLSTLDKTRGQVIGHPYRDLLHESSWETFRSGFPDFLRTGSVEEETCWVKSNGDVIDVWLVGTVVPAPKDSVGHARFVAQDVTVRRRLEAELHEKSLRVARANEELSRKNHELDEFVHVVSHDLQEPLRTLIAFSDFLLKDYGDRLEAEGQEFVRYLVDASRRMRAMIHGMLNLSRAGKVIGDFQEVDLEDLVAVIKTDLRELIRSKNAEVRVCGALPEIWGDRDRIGQLLANLITNGLKYNRSPNPWVEIGAIASASADSAAIDLQVDPGEDAILTVKDNGIGIEPQFHRTIFQLFRRLHTQEEYEGTGAGLAICNKIVEAHGGRIWVESTPGQGATFFIRLGRRPNGSTTTSVSSTLSGNTSTISQAVPDEYNAS